MGESTLLNTSIQLYTIKAAEEGTLLYFCDSQQLIQHPEGANLSNKLLLNLIRMELEGDKSPPSVVKEEMKTEENFGQRKQHSLKEQLLLNWLPKDLKPEEKQEIEAILEVKQLEEDEICIQQNSPIQSCYLLVEGQLNVLEWNDIKHQQTLVDILKPGDRFGENSLIAPSVSPYTIQVFQTATLFILHLQSLVPLLQKPAIQKLLLHLAKYTPDPSKFIKKNYEEMVFSPVEESLSTQENNRLNFLKQHPLTQGFNAEQLQVLNQLLQEQDYEKGEKIIPLPEDKRDLYFILQGQVILNEKQENLLEPGKIKTFQSPQGVNELGFLTNHSTPLIIEMTKKTKLLKLPFNQLKESLEDKSLLLMQLFTNVAYSVESHLDKVKNQEQAELRLKIHHLVKQKWMWILGLIGLILSSLSIFKQVNNELNSGITFLQLLVPAGFIYGFLKDSFKNWGWSTQYLKQALLQAVICIGLIGIVFELLAQLVDMSNFHFFSSATWSPAISLSGLTILNYLFFVVTEEWLRRGIVLLSIQRGLEDVKGRWSVLLSALLFLGYTAIYASPLASLSLFLKDLGLGFLFLRAPHLLGVILIHFVLGLFLASLGWFVL